MGYEWNPALETGIELIDSQHKELFNRFNKLLDALQAGRGRDELDKTLAFLADYVVEHFSDEESYMKKIAYPELDRHHEIHQDFIQSVRELQNNYDSESDELPIMLKKQIFDWLWAHIGREDRKIGEFAKES